MGEQKTSDFIVFQGSHLVVSQAPAMASPLSLFVVCALTSVALAGVSVDRDDKVIDARSARVLNYVVKGSTALGAAIAGETGRVARIDPRRGHS